MECESRILIQECGCVLYYMPRINGNTNICNQDDYSCYDGIKFAIESTSNNSFQCNCLPGCFEIGYTADISTARLTDGGYSVRQSIISDVGPEFAVYGI